MADIQQLLTTNIQFRGFLQIQYLASSLIAMSILLGLYTICKVVLVKETPKNPTNKLTFPPYYALIAYSVTVAVQTILSILYVTGDDSNGNGLTYTLIIINMLKVNFQNLTITLQTFEWFCYWNMINFQKNYDMTRVAVEKRIFKKREQRCQLIFNLTVTTVFFGSLIAIIVLIITLLEENIYEAKQSVVLGETLLVLIFFVVTTILFFREAY